MWINFYLLFLICNQAFLLEANNASNIPIAPIKKQAVLLKAKTMLNSLPVIFEKNEGQADKDVIFLARAKGLIVFFEKTEVVFVTVASNDTETADLTKTKADNFALTPKKANVVRLRFEGAQPVCPVGQERLLGKANYFVGNREVTGISEFGKIAYRAIYPGIDLVFYGRNGDLEYDFIVTPGADPNQIRMKVSAANNVQMTADQGILMGEIHKQKPRVYQTKSGTEEEVESRLVLADGGRISFFIGKYDRHLPLIIDPRIVRKRKLGGTGLDRPYDATFDSGGNLYIVGETYSPDFPTKNPIQNFAGFSNDAFITKINFAGNIIYSTFLGGERGDIALAVAVGPSGNLYVAGDTGSSNFPVSTPIFQLSNGAFVSKLDSTGSRLIYSTYLAEKSGATGIAVRNGCAFIVGGTGNGLTLPQIVNPIQATPAGGHEIFLMKLSPSGRKLLFSSYFGGKDQDYVTDMSMDPSGAIYFTGSTSSRDFPVTPNAFQKKLAGASDAFVSKIDIEKHQLVYSTYIGGKAYDSPKGIAVDKMKNAIITGVTGSKSFPTLNALMGKTYWNENVFVTKLNPSGSGLVYSTYLGGGFGFAIAADNTGDTYVTGESHGCTQPLVNPLAGSPTCGRTFLSNLTPNGSLIYSTYHDLGWGEVLATGTSASVYLIGQTYDADDIVVAHIATQ